MSATATMEYHNPKKVFSDQGVLDCNKMGFGCKGGSPQTAFLYAKYSGLANDLDYKYVSGQSGNTSFCRTFEFPPIYNLSKVCFVALNGNETKLRLIVAQFGPVVVSIDSKDAGLDHYASGVFTSKTCSSSLDDASHAVVSDKNIYFHRKCQQIRYKCHFFFCSQTIVGFGTDSKWGAYWIVRNSWGTDFGENGLSSVI